MKAPAKTVRLISLGCPKNLVDSEVILGLLQKNGWTFSSENEAEVVVINTCSFIREAQEESIDTILTMAGAKEKGRFRHLVVTGCLPQLHGLDLLLELPEVDLFLGTGEFARVPELFEKLIADDLRRKDYINPPTYLYDHQTPRIHSSSPGSVYIKIADGCANFCSYCLIPRIRGPLRSRNLPSVLAEAEKAVSGGVKEINLIAQDITAFGCDRTDGGGLVELLRSLVKVEGLRWIRLLYAHPARITPDLIQLIREEEKICKYLDLPLQHINDRLLATMNRQVTGGQVRELLARLRQDIPGIILRTSLMVGFPGETEKVFGELLNFVKEVQFDRLGVFRYSRENETPAASLKRQVSTKIKDQRYHQVMRLQKQIALRKQKEQVGSRALVLVERPAKSTQILWEGRSAGQAPEVDGLVFLTKGDAVPGEMVEAQITGSTSYDLFAEIIGPA